MMNMVKQQTRCRWMILTVIGAFAFGGCDTLVYEGNPTYMVSGGVETYRDHFALEKETAAIDRGDILQISRDYRARGESPLQLMVTYDPRSKTNTAARATKDAGDLAAMLREQGVRNIDVSTMPVMGSGDSSNTFIGYDALNARGPSECTEILDMEFADQNIGKDYRLGCSVHTYVARQIARPADLLGRDDMDNASGRMLSNSLETYMGGRANTELRGETASD